MQSFLKKNADFTIVVCDLFALCCWILFVVGFAFESSNPNRIEGWNDEVEKFSWYIFCISGILAILFIGLNSAYKRPTLLGLSLFTTSFALLFAGGPLDETGHYLWECGQRDEFGERFTGVGCQEETYDNMCLMFSAVLCYAVFMLAIVFVSSFAPTTTRFTLRSAANVDLSTPFA